MSKSALKQGHLDGLCGIYSIVNAFNNVVPKTNDEFRKNLFRVAIKQLDYEMGLKWAIFEGITVSVLSNIIDVCILYVNKEYNVQVKKKILPSILNNITGLVNSINDFFFEKNGVVIVGVTGRIDHWSVIGHISQSGKKWHMIDSDEQSTILVSKLTTSSITTKSKNLSIIYNEVIGIYLVPQKNKK